MLLHGDNLAALPHLRDAMGLGGKIQLIYIDPPYGTGQHFTVSEGRAATVSRAGAGELAYDDSMSGEDYLRFLEPRLRLLRELLAADGSIYVHTDLKMGHYVKCLMDRVFGARNFLNDITRIKCNPKNFARRGYGNVKDVILFYSRGPRIVWNEPRQEVDIDRDPRFRAVDATGRRYTTTPLHAPGETRDGPTGQAWRGKLPPPGRHWRYAPEVLERIDREERIEWSSTGNPRKIIYADDVAARGARVQDVWTFKDPQSPRYPTEKNLEMLRRIVSASSNPGDWVLDAFCGSGTTVVAARELGRRAIGIDSSARAIALASERCAGAAVIPMAQWAR